MVELGQWVLQRLVVVDTVTGYVDGQVDGIAHRTLVGLSLSCNLEAGTVVGSRHDDGQACCEAYTVVGHDSLKGRHTLVVVHRQYSIELRELAIAEEGVSCIGTEGLQTVLLQLLDGRLDDLLLLFAQQTVGAGMGIQCQYGNAWVRDAHVALQTSVQRGGLLDDNLLRDGLRHVLDGYVLGYQCDTQVFVDQHRQRLWVTAQGVVTGSRGRHQHVDQSVSYIAPGALHSLACSVLRLLCLLSCLNLHFFVEDGQQVQPSVPGLVSLFNVVELQLHVECLAVVACNFW